MAACFTASDSSGRSTAGGGSSAPASLDARLGDEEEPLTVDQALIAWESMLSDANQTMPAVGRGVTLRRLAFSALRTTMLLILVALAILVLLPAMIAAQPTFVG
jgi:hypothetical protein